MNEPQQTTGLTEAAPPAAPAPRPTTSVDDLALLLSEFEAQTKPKAMEQQPPGEIAPAAATANPPTDLAGTVEALDAAVKNGIANDALKSQFGILQNSVQALYEHQRQQQDQKDLDRVVESADALLRDAGLAVGKDFARRWLLAEAQLDQNLVAAFDARNQSPQHERYYKKQEQKALQRLIDAAKREPDQEATANRMAVAAAVRGTSTKMPELKPPRYGDMTDAEFNAEKKKHGV